MAPELDPGVSAALNGFAPIIARVLAQRGLTTRVAAEAFLAGEANGSTDPLLLTGLPESADRLGRAIDQHEPVVVYGDYDVDGVTATALMVQVLSALGADVRPYIPHREEEGRGGGRRQGQGRRRRRCGRRRRRRRRSRRCRRRWSGRR